MATSVEGLTERSTARLEAAIAAYDEALQEQTRACAPFDWANNTGSQGVAMVLLAERRGDAEMAKRALQQIEVALKASRDSGDAPSAAFYDAQLPKARAIRDYLAKR